jgi:FkbM family methyltransferase
MMTFRRLIELLSRGKTLTRRIAVDGKKYPIIVSPDAQLKYLKGRSLGGFDQDLINIAQAFVNEDSVVWDIGANIGVFTFASAIMAKKGIVISIEADNWLAGILRRTKKLKPYQDRDIRILSTAISENDGVATFQIAARGRASNALEAARGRSQMGGVREKQYVPTLTMNALLGSFSSSPDFVKIDVEGAEAMVVSGGSKIIHEIRPIFYIEVGLMTVDEVKSVFEKANYKAYSSTGGSLMNIFFVPNEGSSKFESRAKKNVKFLESVDSYYSKKF